MACSRHRPYDPKTKARSSLVKNPEKEFVVLTRGAPEFIIEMCNVSQIEKERILAANTKFAEEGLRVIAFAYKTMSDTPQKRTDAESKLTFASLIGFHDPIRPEVADALKLAKQAGIRVIMITGDQKATALSIAEKIGLYNDYDSTAATIIILDYLTKFRVNPTYEQFYSLAKNIFIEVGKSNFWNYNLRFRFKSY